MVWVDMYCAIRQREEDYEEKMLELARATVEKEMERKIIFNQVMYVIKTKYDDAATPKAALDTAAGVHSTIFYTKGMKKSIYEDVIDILDSLAKEGRVEKFIPPDGEDPLYRFMPDVPKPGWPRRPCKPKNKCILKVLREILSK